MAIYNSRPQSGRLKGLSPKEMLDRKIKATGFEARRPSEEAFDLIFSRQEIRTVRQGCINIGPRQFHGAYLDAMLPGASVEVLIPLLADRDYLFVRQRNGNPVRLDCLPNFAHGDREGAKLQARLEADKGKAVRGLETQIDKTVSTFENQKAAANFAAPNAPSPANWTPAIDKTGGIITDKEFQQREDAEKRALAEKFLAFFPPEAKREASGGNC